VAAGRTDRGVSWGREDSHGPAGGARFGRAVDAAHSLSDLLWEELREELTRGVDSAPTRRSAELAERVAGVASTVALLAGDRNGTTPAMAASSAANGAVLVDEHDAAPTDALRDASTRRVRDRLDAGGHARQPAWLSLIESALAQFERDHAPFAVLLVEVIDRGEPVGSSEHIGVTVARALDAIRPASIAPEDSRRYWLLVPQADRLGARFLADRLARAFSGPDADDGRTDAAETYFAALSARRSRGQAAAPPRLVAGTAACPENGCDSSALIAHAHIELAEARSARLPFVAVTEPV
jgi:hypothetical protein